MKCSKFYFFGMFGLGAYTIGIITYDRTDVAHYEQIYINDKSVLKDAKYKWNIANTNYLESQNKIEDSENTIKDAKCYINNSKNFTSQLKNYCITEKTSANSIDTLHNNYGVKLIFLNDIILESQGSDIGLICRTVSGEKCDSNHTNCNLTVKKECKYGIYHFPQYTHEHHGATAQGPGSQLELTCGKFSYATGTATYTTSYKTPWSSSTTLFSKIIKQNRDVYYISTVKIADHINNTIEPTQTNLESLASSILKLIKQECDKLIDSLKPQSYYKKIIDTQINLLPKLYKDAEEKKVILDETTANKSLAQAELHTAEHKYLYSLSKLMLMLSPAFLVGWWLHKTEANNTSNDYDEVSICNMSSEYNNCHSVNECFNLFKEKFDRFLLRAITRVETNNQETPHSSYVIGEGESTFDSELPWQVAREQDEERGYIASRPSMAKF